MLENLRPISLLNVDYKIITKAIVKRLEKVLPSIINPDQTGYMKGCYIGENVRLIQDIIEHTNLTGKKGSLYFFILKKLLTRLNGHTSKPPLTFFNFGPDILNRINIFYNDVSSCVLNNGHASTFFPLQRGVRQGRPLSGILFVLGIKLFGRALKNNQSIKGILANNHEIKVIQYADDITVFVSDQDSVVQLLDLLQNFSLLSGLEISAATLSLRLSITYRCPLQHFMV